MNKCYRCDADGVTREHAPPYSFFPPGFKDNLVTVPSCHDHNTKNSKDVEYIRNIIVSHISTNPVARAHFQGKVKRSYKKSPKLLKRTFEDAVPILVNGEETVVPNIDILRFKLVMVSLAYALYYKDFKHTYAGTWEIISPSLLVSPNFFRGIPDGWEEVRQLFAEWIYTEIPTPQPDVFRYGIHKWDDNKLVYLFQFYGGFLVNALAWPPDIEKAWTTSR